MFRFIRFLILMGVIYICFQSLNVSAEDYYLPSPPQPDPLFRSCPEGKYKSIFRTESEYINYVDSYRNMLEERPDKYIGCSGPHLIGDYIYFVCDKTIVGSDNYFNRHYGLLGPDCTDIEGYSIPQDTIDPVDAGSCDVVSVQSFFESNYPQGITGVWDSSSSTFLNQPVMQTLNLTLPSSGSAPQYSIDMDLGFANFGNIDIQIPEYVFGFVRIILLICAGFTCRSIIFNG